MPQTKSVMSPHTCYRLRPPITNNSTKDAKVVRQLRIYTVAFIAWVLYLGHALSLGDVFSTDFHLRRHQTLEQIGTVQAEQECDLFSLWKTMTVKPSQLFWTWTRDIL